MSSAIWSYYLANTSDMSLIGELPARGKKLDLTLNRPGSAGCSIPLDDSLASSIQTLSTSLIAVRNRIVRWSGPVWTLDVNAPANTLGITAVGWLEELNHRTVRGPYTDLTATLRSTEEQVFVGVDAGTIAQTLLSKANAQRDMNGVVRPTHITWGSADTSMNRNREYKKGQGIGDAIKELSDIEAGFDYYVDPTTRQFYVKYDTVIVGSTIKGIGSDKRNIVLSYEWGPANLAGAGYTSDAGRMCNRMQVNGQYGSAIAEDRSAMDATGFMFEEYVGLTGPGTTDNGILLAYGGAEVAVRAMPQKIYNIQPFAYQAASGQPEPFVDYGLGDVVSLSARSGAWTEDKNSCRIFGMSIEVDENGNEKVGSLQLTQSG